MVLLLIVFFNAEKEAKETNENYYSYDVLFLEHVE